MLHYKTIDTKTLALSLTYFEDAEIEEAPVLIQTINWEKVKSTIIFETKIYIKDKPSRFSF